MTVSNSTDFSLTANQIISSALELLGVKAEEEELSAADLDRGNRWLNIMFKDWQAAGVMTWTLTEGTITLTQSNADYTFSSGGDFTTVPVDIVDMRINRGGNDLPMTRLNRADYYAIPNKTTEGYPTQWFYDRQRDSGTLYVWPAPDSTAGTLKFTYRRRIMDMDGTSDNADMPQEWYKAAIYGLAVLLIPIYGKSGTPRAVEIRQEADTAYQGIIGFDNGEGEASLYILPASYSRAR